jgi:hypothetical protein
LDKKLIFWLVAAAIAATLALALLVSGGCKDTNPVTINNNAGEHPVMTDPPQAAAQVIPPEPEKPNAPFNHLKFWSVIGAGVIAILVLLVATGNLHPFRKFKLTE